MNLVYLGLFLEICSTLSGTVGKLLIRFGALLERKNFKRGRRLSVAGLVLNTTCSPTLDICAYTFAPQAMIAPFAGLDVVWNTLLAPCVLGEVLTKMKLIAIGMIFAGVSCTLFFVETVEPEYTISYCRNLLFSWRTGIYCGLLSVFIGMNLRLQKRLPKGDNRRGLSLGVTGGTLAGNMFCVKILGEFIQQSFNQDGFDTLWSVFIVEHTGLFLVVLFGAIFFAISNVFFVATGMREFEALFMVTVFEGSMIISGCICGTVVMRDFDKAGLPSCLGFFLCLVVMVVGIYILFVAQMQATSSLFNNTASIAGVGPSGPELADSPAEISLPEHGVHGNITKIPALTATARGMKTSKTYAFARPRDVLSGAGSKDKIALEEIIPTIISEEEEGETNGYDGKTSDFQEIDKTSGPQEKKAGDHENGDKKKDENGNENGKEGSHSVPEADKILRALSLPFYYPFRRHL